MSDELERRLAATDFSADSRVRSSLRARLLNRRAAPRFVPARAAALALAFGAAALALLLLPRSRRPRPEELPIAARPAPPPAAPAAPRRAAARRTVYPRGELGLPVLPGVLAETAGAAHESPLSSRAVDRIIDIHRGRAVRGKDATAVVWEIDGTRYGLETRRITLQDIFETRAL